MWLCYSCKYGDRGTVSGAIFIKSQLRLSQRIKWNLGASRGDMTLLELEGSGEAWELGEIPDAPN